MSTVVDKVKLLKHLSLTPANGTLCWIQFLIWYTVYQRRLASVRGLSSIIFQNMNAWLRMNAWGKSIILDTYCDICLYMLKILLYKSELMLAVCYHYKTFVNIDTIDLNIPLSDFNCNKRQLIPITATLLICHCVVKYYSITNNYSTRPT